jgi:prepilin-type N-terminal cleavage/methylation domain-containing protein
MKKHFSNLFSKLKLRTSGNQRGFTLIEILITLALMSIVVVGVFVVLNNAYGFTSRADAHETAVNLAEYEMRYVKDNSVTFIPNATEYAASYPSGSAYNGFTATIAASPVLEVNADNKEQLIEVTVTGRNITYILRGYKVNFSY